jgi:hypothetical protein
MVCEGDYEERHPQDFVRGVTDNMSVPWARDEAQDTFVPIHYTEYPVEEVDFSEAASTQVGRVLADTITGSEVFSIIRTYFSNETITATESKAFVGLYEKTDSMLLDEVVDAEASIPTAESQATSEYHTIHYVKVFPEPVQIVVTGNVVNSSALNGSSGVIVDAEVSEEDLDFSEGIFFDTIHYLDDVGTWVEAILVAKNITLADSFTLTETLYADHATLVETIVGSETAVYQMDKGAIEVLNILENLSFVGGYSLTDSATFSEAQAVLFGKGLSEFIGQNESWSNYFAKANAETINVSESFNYSLVTTSNPLNSSALDTYSLG